MRTVIQKSKVIPNSQFPIPNFPTAYAPNTTYISAIAHSERFNINIKEPYIRQTFRNRCEILTSQGVQKLSIPIDKKSTRSGMIKDTKIDYAENWKRQHWRSLQAAYSNSPYFLYYQDELNVFYEKRYAFLVDFNLEILTFLLKKMQIENRCTVNGTGYTEYSKPTVYPVPCTVHHTYQQVFNPQNFVPNLSSFDLLFNCGPESKSYLCKA